jgi:hypothetical protein
MGNQSYTHTFLDNCEKIGYICNACNDNVFVNYRNCSDAPGALLQHNSGGCQGTEDVISSVRTGAKQAYIIVLIYTT